MTDYLGLRCETTFEPTTTSTYGKQLLDIFKSNKNDCKCYFDLFGIIHPDSRYQLITALARSRALLVSFTSWALIMDAPLRYAITAEAMDPSSL